MLRADFFQTLCHSWWILLYFRILLKKNMRFRKINSIPRLWNNKHRRWGIWRKEQRRTLVKWRTVKYKNGWEMKNAFKSWCSRRLESPLNCKKTKPVNHKGNQPCIFNGRSVAETETPILWTPYEKRLFFGKGPYAGKDWRQKETRAADNLMPLSLTLTSSSFFPLQGFISSFSQNILKRHESHLFVGNLCFHPCN